MFSVISLETYLFFDGCMYIFVSPHFCSTEVRAILPQNGFVQGLIFWMTVREFCRVNRYLMGLDLWPKLLSSLHQLYLLCLVVTLFYPQQMSMLTHGAYLGHIIPYWDPAFHQTDLFKLPLIVHFKCVRTMQALFSFIPHLNTKILCCMCLNLQRVMMFEDSLKARYEMWKSVKLLILDRH